MVEERGYKEYDKSGLASSEIIYYSLRRDDKDKAIEFLKVKCLDAGAREQIRAAQRKDPEKWWAEYHSIWGMAIRNALRKGGFGEEFFRINNLDDIYIQLVEEAVQ